MSTSNTIFTDCNPIHLNIIKMKVLYTLFVMSLTFLSLTSSAQYDEDNKLIQFLETSKLIEDQFDLVASNWLEKSAPLKTYSGVKEYCVSLEYRTAVDKTLKEIHHYDSLILISLEDPASYLGSNVKEGKKTLKDIQEMEEEFSAVNFIKSMKETCAYRKKLERNADDLKGGIADQSYDGQVLLVEADLRKYLGKIDRLALRIDDHLHVLHINN